MFLVLLIIDIVVSIYIGKFAESSKGKSFWNYFFLSLFLTPIIALIILLIAKADEEKLVSNGTAKKCDYCKELIKIDATVCKHCGKEVSQFNNTSFNGFSNSKSISDKKKGMTVGQSLFWLIIIFAIFIMVATYKKVGESANYNSNNYESKFSNSTYGLDCDEIWKIHNECVSNSLKGLPCAPGTDVIIPLNCRK